MESTEPEVARQVEEEADELDDGVDDECPDEHKSALVLDVVGPHGLPDQQCQLHESEKQDQAEDGVEESLLPVAYLFYGYDFLDLLHNIHYSYIRMMFILRVLLLGDVVVIAVAQRWSLQNSGSQAVAAAAQMVPA